MSSMSPSSSTMTLLLTICLVLNLCLCVDIWVWMPSELTTFSGARFAHAFYTFVGTTSLSIQKVSTSFLFQNCRQPVSLVEFVLREYRPHGWGTSCRCGLVCIYITECLAFFSFLDELLILIESLVMTRMARPPLSRAWKAYLAACRITWCVL